MARYRKKLYEFDAFRMTREAFEDKEAWPDWLKQAWFKESREPGALYMWKSTTDTVPQLTISTHTGSVRVYWGWWICKPLDSDIIHVCVPDYFEQSYELAPASGEIFRRDTDERIDELLRANNVLVERARGAERRADKAETAFNDARLALREANVLIGKQSVTLERRAAALREGAKAFRWYEQIHASKTPPDDDKAKRNREFAEILEAACAPEEAKTNA